MSENQTEYNALSLPAGADWREKPFPADPQAPPPGPRPPPSETVEQEIQRKGLTAPRVTEADVEANIVDVEYVRHVSKSGQTLRWAVLVLRNGFALAGEPSASVSPENDSEELGRRFALENSKRALWPLMGYALRNELAKRDER